jgi:hypothetical protein
VFKSRTEGRQQCYTSICPVPQLLKSKYLNSASNLLQYISMLISPFEVTQPALLTVTASEPQINVYCRSELNSLLYPYRHTSFFVSSQMFFTSFLFFLRLLSTLKPRHTLIIRDTTANSWNVLILLVVQLHSMETYNTYTNTWSIFTANSIWLLPTYN